MRKLQPVSNVTSFAEAKEKVGMLGLLSVLLMVPFTLSNCFVGPGLALVINEFGPNAKLVITIPSLLSVLFSVIGGWMMQKMSVRKVFLIAGVFNILGGLMPVVFNANVGWILASRVVYGVGFGLAFPCAATLTNAVFAGEFKDKFLGISTFFTMAVAFIFGWMSAWLMNFGWKGLFAGYLIFVPMMVLAAFAMPNNTPISVPKEEKAAKKGGIFNGLNALAIYVLIGTVIYNIAIMSTSTNLSDIMMNEEHLPGTASAAAANVGLVGQMIIGLLFANFRKLFKNFMPVVSMFVIGLGCVVLVFSHSTWMFCLGQLLTGAGFGLFNPTMTIICNDVVAPEGRANMMGLYSSATGIGQFLTTYGLAALCTIFALSDNSRGPWITGGFLIVALAVVTLFVVLGVQKKKGAKTA